MNTKIIIGILAIGGIFLIVALTGTNDINGGEPAQRESVNEQTEEVSIPNGIPMNVPMYPGSVLESVQDAEEEDGVRNVTLSLSTEDTIADVNTWYRGALKENGWAITSDRNVGGYVLLRSENGNIVTFMQAAVRSDLGKVIITQRIQVR